MLGKIYTIYFDNFMLQFVANFTTKPLCSLRLCVKIKLLHYSEALV